MTKAPSSPKPAGIWSVFISTLYLSSLKHRLSEKKTCFLRNVPSDQCHIRGHLCHSRFIQVAIIKLYGKRMSSTFTGCHKLFWTNIHHHPTRDTYVTCTTMPINPPFEEFPLYSCQKNNTKWTNIHKRLQTIETMVKPVSNHHLPNVSLFQMWHLYQPRWITITGTIPEVGLSKTNPPVESRNPDSQPLLKRFAPWTAGLLKSPSDRAPEISREPGSFRFHQVSPYKVWCFCWPNTWELGPSKCH